MLFNMEALENKSNPVCDTMKNRIEGKISVE